MTYYDIIILGHPLSLELLENSPKVYNYKQSILTAIFLHIDKLFVKYIHRKKYLYNFALVILLNQHDILI